MQNAFVAPLRAIGGFFVVVRGENGKTVGQFETTTSSEAVTAVRKGYNGGGYGSYG